jgi:hypothetical protein
MYPDEELTRLAAHKASLQLAIAMRRDQCARAAERLARPLEWLDRVAAFWRRFSPIIRISSVPLAFLAKRVLLPRFKLLGALARWGPLAYGALKGMGSIMGTRPEPGRGGT